MLLLFDIDGTLILEGTDAHARAMRMAMMEVHGIAEPKPAGIQSAGRTDNEICRLVLTQVGVSATAIDDGAPEVARIACERYADLVEDFLAERVAPGMDALLTELGADHILALVTGNFEPIARMKLRAAGIGHHFPSGQGGFGSDSEDRTELPAIARARAGTRGQPYARQRTVVIGDTPRDIACARADEVRVIGITTGPHDATELAHADVVVADVTGLRDALRAR